MSARGGVRASNYVRHITRFWPPPYLPTHTTLCGRRAASVLTADPREVAREPDHESLCRACRKKAEAQS